MPKTKSLAHILCVLPLAIGRPETTPEAIGARLAAFRKANGISIRAMADATGIDRMQLSKAERGVRRISLDMLMALYATYEVSADFLLFGRRGNLTADLAQRITDIERGDLARQRDRSNTE